VVATVTVEVVDEEGKVTLGQPEPEHAPLPGEAAEGTDTETSEALAAEALEAAQELERSGSEDPEGEAAAAAQGAATEVLTDVPTGDDDEV
jgi:hypothetical protein